MNSIKNKYMKNLAFVLVLFFIANTTTLQAQTINTDKSEVKFHITGGGVFKVKGTFKGMQGDFNFDSNSLENANFNICIDAPTINTKNKKRDDHLRNEDFFDVEKYPNVCFESISVSQLENGYTTKGNLTIYGVTKEVDIPFEFKNNTFIGSIVIDRFDYDLGKDFGTMRVGKEATITIVCVVK